MKTVVFLFHPSYEQSRVNKALVNGLDNDIEVRNLYELYPDFNINVSNEQVPMFWYSSPALVQQWEEKVLEHGWAYGSAGNVLQGKELIIAVSPGADNYGRDGFAKYTIHELLRPFQDTSRLIGMHYLTPFVTIGASSISDQVLQEQVIKYNNYLHQESIPVLGDFE